MARLVWFLGLGSQSSIVCSWLLIFVTIVMLLIETFAKFFVKNDLTVIGILNLFYCAIIVIVLLGVRPILDIRIGIKTFHKLQTVGLFDLWLKNVLIYWGLHLLWIIMGMVTIFTTLIYSVSIEDS